MKSANMIIAALTVAWAFCVSGLASASERAGQSRASTNHALKLDGSTADMRVSDGPSLHSLSNAITLEIWFKAASFPTGEMLVSSLLRKNINANAENFFLRFRIIRGRPWIEFSPGTQVGTLRAQYDFVVSRWFHLAGTYDGKEMAIFVNGSKIKSDAASGLIAIDDSDLFVGKGDPEWSSGEFFDGEVDEIRIWNMARSANDIKAALKRTLTGREAGLIGYWNFDSGTAKDSSESKNDGHLEGAAQIVQSARDMAAVPAEQAAKAEEEQLHGRGVAQRLETMEALWKHLNEIYPALEYKGIYGHEWIEPAEELARKAKNDEEFRDILLQLMASLKDTHTRIISYPDQPKLASPPIALNRVEGKVAVIHAAPEAGLSAGDTLTEIDGRPVDDCFVEQMKRACNSTERGRAREVCERLLRGKPGTEIKITIQDASGRARTVTVRRDSVRSMESEPAITFRRLENSIGLVRIARWAGRDLVARFDQALEEFKTAPALIIDVRGNGGGDDQMADEVNGRFATKPVVSSIDLWRKPGTDQYQKTIGWVKPRGPWTYKGRVAVLIDEGCASACEHFVSGIEALGSILLVGEPTNGAGGGPTGVTLPDGTFVRISRALGLRVNGVVFEGHGIPPHILSAPTLADLRQGRDATLEIAKEWVVSDKPILPRIQPLGP